MHVNFIYKNNNRRAKERWKSFLVIKTRKLHYKMFVVIFTCLCCCCWIFLLSFTVKFSLLLTIIIKYILYKLCAECVRAFIVLTCNKILEQSCNIYYTNMCTNGHTYICIPEEEAKQCSDDRPKICNYFINSIFFSSLLK